ncbi:MAG TPA: SDR family NAD(P)-dependent oxidoreductase [Solirubrobacteraceae bacterium]|nr:SDR family NAD(P)-dependent oxidoreductase [Solirubrobacteraceae bacterium]
MELRGARVLLTGAAGGIGSATALALRSRGAELVISGRNKTALDELAARVGARVEVADLAERAQLHSLLERAGEVDVLVANAALPAAGRLESFSELEIDRALEVNLHAPIIMARVLVPQMLARGRGHLVFMSSISGKAYSARTSIYCTTKFGLRGFAGALRADLHGTNVGASAVFPGFVSDAGMFVTSGAKLPPGVATRTPEQVAEGVVRAIERDIAEVDVAPFSIRVGAAVAGVAPDATARLQRMLGSDRVSEEMEAGHRERR